MTNEQLAAAINDLEAGARCPWDGRPCGMCPVRCRLDERMEQMTTELVGRALDGEPEAVELVEALTS